VIGFKVLAFNTLKYIHRPHRDLSRTRDMMTPSGNGMGER
jgi:hypothetical protein